MITERLMKLGTWSLLLTDPSLRDEIEYFEHVVIIPAELRIPDLYSDASLLSLARYTGVIRTKRVTGPAGGDDSLELAGHGLEGWLGDEGMIGEIIETERSYSVDSLANVLDRSGSTPYGLLRDAAGAQTAIQAGTLFSVAGTYTGDHRFVDQRSAIRYVVDLFSAEYRVNPDFTLDAGLDSDLFVAGTPTAILARKVTDGRDPTIDGVPLASFESAEDVKDFTTRVVLLAEGSGELLQTGSADAVSVPYKDPFNNDVVRVRMVSEAETSPANANSRAQLHLNRFGALRQELTISTKNFDVEGTFEVGDLVYVWDPTDDALVDTTNEVRYRGAVLNPVAIRVLGQTFPVTEGMAVFIRHADGTYLDVTDLVTFEEGETSLEVGENPRTLGGGENGQILSGRVNTETNVDDGGTPDVPGKTGTPWPTASYVDGEGRTRAQIATSWTQPLNTDASTITDGSHYSVRWRRNGETDYQYSTVDWGTTAFLIQDLASGVTYEVSIAAVDFFANSAGYGTDESVVAQGDTIAPSTPAAPIVAGSPLALQISHDLGKASGGTFNLESDLDHLKVYVSTTSGFTPAEANRAGEIPATNAHLTLGITVIKTFEILDTATRYVKVTAVDRAGNESAASGQASVTAELVDTAYITDLAVTNAKIGLLAVDTAQIAALAVTDAKIANLAADKITAGTIDAEIIKLGITGGNGVIESTNYVAGSAGFHFDGSGFAELGDATIRGKIEIGDGTGLIVIDDGSWAANKASIELNRGRTNPAILEVDGTTGGLDLMPAWDTTQTNVAALTLLGDQSTTADAILNAGLNGKVTLTGGGGAQILVDDDVVITAGQIFMLSSVAAPGLSRSADPNTGIHMPGSDEIDFISAAAIALRVQRVGNQSRLVGNVTSEYMGIDNVADTFAWVTTSIQRARILSTGLEVLGGYNASIELGRNDGTAWTPFLDFHTGHASQDYGARIIVDGGVSATTGANSMKLQAEDVQFKYRGGTLRGAFTATEVQARGDNGAHFTDYDPLAAGTIDAQWFNAGGNVRRLDEASSMLSKKRDVVPLAEFLDTGGVLDLDLIAFRMRDDPEGPMHVGTSADSVGERLPAMAFRRQGQWDFGNYSRLVIPLIAEVRKLRDDLTKIKAEHRPKDPVA